jgi:ADP-ribosylglycohydrolase
MLGAIIGDIVGSVYEWHNIKIKDFPLFRDDCFFTDDTVMTIATADAIMKARKRGDFPGEDDFIDAYKSWGCRYPNAGYGGQFGAWLHTDSGEPYNSWGNGSAMRVSPIAFSMQLENTGYKDITDRTLLCAKVYDLTKSCASVTHNHPEGIKGACAVSDAILYMRFAREIDHSVPNQREALKGFIENRYDYDLNKTLDEIRPTYRFNESCQETVPQAIIAFLESTDFEDAIRNAISLGGDSDTLAAITGDIAQAAYGIPEWIKEKALTYLDEPLREVYNQWCAFVS